MASLSRRQLLQIGGALGVATAINPAWDPLFERAFAAHIRQPNSLPQPNVAAGTVNETMPFDHIVVVMMENHSFDNYLGALASYGTRAADGLTFNAKGIATNTNPGPSGAVRSFPFTTTAQGDDVTQTWNATHAQIDGGKMDGFVTGNSDSSQAMGYFGPRSCRLPTRSPMPSPSPIAGSALHRVRRTRIAASSWRARHTATSSRTRRRSR